MSEFFFYSSNKALDIDKVKSFLNPTKNFVVKDKVHKNTFSAVSYLQNSPLQGERQFENERWLILFPEDLIEHTKVPFQKFINILENNYLERLADLNGYYSIIAYDKINEDVFVISDRLANYPVFYFASNEKIIISSTISAFTNLLAEPIFNKKWLYNYLFFNFPMDEVTILENVFKLLPSAYLKINLASGRKEIKNYTEYFNKKGNLKSGKQSFEFAKEIFRQRIPKYFLGSDKIACALTAGWDGRTNLALAPDSEKVTAYTYGMMGCRDLIESKKVTTKLNIKSKHIYFDENFFKIFPELLFETVFVSSGLQGILRTTLLYIYRNLAQSDFNMTISGLNYDVLFRGHFGTPSHISPHFVPTMKNDKIEINQNYWENILIGDYKNFYDEIINKLNRLRSKIGPFDSPSSHLSYNNYYAMPRYFGGEMKVASNFLTIRVPGYDSEIMELAYSIKESCLSYSQMTGHKRNSRDEMIIQAYIFTELGGKFYELPIRNTKPSIVLAGEIPFFIYTYYSRIQNKIIKLLAFKTKRNYLEDWNTWLNVKYRSFVDDLVFNREALINEYLNKNFLQEIEAKRELHVLGKIITTEVILRLIKNKWERFW